MNRISLTYFIFTPLKSAFLLFLQLSSSFSFTQQLKVHICIGHAFCSCLWAYPLFLQGKLFYPRLIFGNIFSIWPGEDKKKMVASFYQLSTDSSILLGKKVPQKSRKKKKTAKINNNKNKNIDRISIIIHAVNSKTRTWNKWAWN